ncbi:MAG: hypothetical protein M1833_001482 [Piccolia ochrophora]|nr:MAG: hypothetical protein M1833_001482 [Piccolia ochrophora]
MNPQGRQGSGKQGLDRTVTVSKALSFLLRHGAEKEGVQLDEEGYASVADVLAWRKLKSLKVTFRELRHVVRDNEKQRFSLTRRDRAGSSASAASPSDTPRHDEDDDDPSHYLIRATQGHSLRLESSAHLTPISTPPFPRAIHGTTASAYTLILTSGALSRMNRTHIHFAPGLPTPDAPVVSGFRTDSAVLIEVDVDKCVAAGMTWWRSENGVLLTEGFDGKVGTEYWVRAVGRKGGNVLWEGGEREGWREVIRGLESAGGRRGRGQGRGRGRGRGRARTPQSSGGVGGQVENVELREQ